MTIIGAGQTNVCFLLDTSNGTLSHWKPGTDGTFPQGGWPTFPACPFNSQHCGCTTLCAFLRRVGFHTAPRIQIQSARSAAKRATSKFYWWRLREKQRIVSNVVPALCAIQIEPIRGDGFMSMFGTKEKSSK